MSGLDKLETRIVRLKLADLIQLEKNPHKQTDIEHKQLIDNMAGDQVMLSAPVVYRGEILSGNHRVAAAIKAGIVEADVIEIITELTLQRKRAIALSQNGIKGYDDKTLLAEFYRDLDINWKQYTGLTDSVLGKDKAKLESLSLTEPKYQEVTVLFLPEELDVFMQALRRVEGRTLSRQSPTLIGRYNDFRIWFDAMVKIRKVKGLTEQALILRQMAELAMKALDAEEANVLPQAKQA